LRGRSAPARRRARRLHQQKGESLGGLPPGAAVGTSSLRRQAQVRRLRPDLRVVDFRGNVETRLKKLDQGLADATLLALAGLERLNLTAHATSILSPDEMLPAVAQGAIGVTCRESDSETRELLQPLDDHAAVLRVACERAFLARLEGSCKTPIAGLAVIVDGALRFRGLILTPDGSAWHEIERTGAIEDAERIGSEAGQELIARAGPEFLASFG
jgi:hydroxymethylbilane synthase